MPVSCWVKRGWSKLASCSRIWSLTTLQPAICSRIVDMAGA